MTALMYLLALGSLVCWILVLIRLFKAKGVGHGILGIICGLYPFIWGWIKAKELGLTKIMIAWTACWVLSVPVSMSATAKMTADMQKMIEESQKQQQAAPAPQQ